LQRGGQTRLKKEKKKTSKKRFLYIFQGKNRREKKKGTIIKQDRWQRKRKEEMNVTKK
jgi:hypothetical protein